MTNITTLFLTVGLSTLILTSCNNSDNSKTSEKELELQKRELDIKQKELELKEKELNQKETSSKMETTRPTVNTSTIKSELPKEKSSAEGYNFDKHNDIKVFVNDLAKAVSSGDKNSISQMINFPLIDTWGDNPGNQSPSFGCKNSNQFFEKYDKIFTKGVVAAIKNKKYRAADNSDEMFEDVIENGEYLIEGDGNIDGESKRPHNMLGIKKVNGKFKVYAIKFYS